MGRRVRREVHGEEYEKGGRGDVRGRGELPKTFEFYALLTTRFSLRLRLVRCRGGRHYAPTSVTVPTASTIHLFKMCLGVVHSTKLRDVCANIGCVWF